MQIYKTQEQIDADSKYFELMNKIKVKGAELGELIDELQSTDGLDQHAIAIGKTELQTGTMWLVRGVAQPESF